MRPRAVGPGSRRKGGEGRAYRKPRKRGRRPYAYGEMFERLRQKLQDRNVRRQREEFDRAADESAPAAEPDDDRRARDLPDPLGDFNEMQRMGPSV
jgi:hypothetical protein